MEFIARTERYYHCIRATVLLLFEISTALEEIPYFFLFFFRHSCRDTNTFLSVKCIDILQNPLTSIRFGHLYNEFIDTPLSFSFSLYLPLYLNFNAEFILDPVGVQRLEHSSSWKTIVNTIFGLKLTIDAEPTSKARRQQRL